MLWLHVSSVGVKSSGAVIAKAFLMLMLTDVPSNCLMISLNPIVVSIVDIFVPNVVSMIVFGGLVLSLMF